MPSVYDIKPRFQALLRPAVAKLARLGVTPNAVTIAAVLLSIGVGALIVWLGHEHARVLLLLPAALLLRMALNAVDGMLAREHDQTSRLGGLLNEIGDVVSDIALYAPLALVPGFPPIAVAAFVVAGVCVEYMGVLGPTIGSTRRYEGPMGKSDRALCIGAIALLVGLGVPPEPWVGWIVWIAAALAVFTMWNRGRAALRDGNEPAPQGDIAEQGKGAE